MALLNNDIVQVTFRGTCFNQRILMVLNYLINGDFPVVNSIQTDLGLIRTAVLAGGVLDMQTPYLAALPPQYTLNEVRAQRIRATRSAFFSTVLVGAVGTNVNPATVSCDSAGITRRTDVAGRNKVSSLKIGPCPDGASAAGQITGAYTALLNAVGSKSILAFTPPTSGSLVIPVVFHPTTNTFDILNNFFVQPESRVMNRRVVGRGE